MCLIKADGGFEVFGRTDDARLDVRFFSKTRRQPIFYLFRRFWRPKAVRSGRLRPGGVQRARERVARAQGVPAGPATENVSKYLRRKKLPKTGNPVQLWLISRRGLTVPPLPKQPRRPPLGG